MKLRVVIFDDDVITLQLVAKLVTSRGHEVLSYNEPTICPLYKTDCCACPQEAACADVILTDNSMPRMTGLEFIRRQSLRGCKGIINNKAIMSGGWTSEEREAARMLGCKIFSKPFDVKELLSWLGECEKNVDAARKLIALA